MTHVRICCVIRGGLVSGFYSRRQQCYVTVVAQKGLPVGTADPDYNKCLDQVAWSFQHDIGGQKCTLSPPTHNTHTCPATCPAPAPAPTLLLRPGGGVVGCCVAHVAGPVCGPDPVGDTVAISQKLLSKWLPEAGPAPSA